MGLLVEGKWVDQWYDTKKSKGEFVRSQSIFHGWVKKDRSTEFAPEKDRYHLYASFACPWASRALIFRKLKKLEDVISLSVVDYFMADQGWFFSDNPGCIPDTVNHKQHLSEVYLIAKSDYTGRVTVPILWDKKTNTIVNNESADIIRMLNSEFDEFGDASVDFYPEQLRNDIDKINDHVYHTINNGVYKCGFATSQEAYEQAYDKLFTALDGLDDLLAKQKYLVGNQITEADWRLFTTLIRFDAVYHGHFKCNKKRLLDYQHLQRYVEELYRHPGVAETVNMTHIKNHYYMSHKTINPTGIVPKGPQLDFLQN